MSNILRGKHGVDRKLVLFKGLKLFLFHFEGIDVRLFMLFKLKLYILPEINYLFDAFFHLRLVFGHLSDILHLVFYIE